jgi:peptide/nickel transport system permease protein
MSRARYIAARTLQIVVMLWLILTFLFFFFRQMPGSFLDIMLIGGASPEQIAQIKEQWGLNDPLYIQYLRYLVNFVTGDVGTSLSARIPVWELVQMRIFNSFILVAPGITAGFLIGSTVGTLLGIKRGSRFERGGIGFMIFLGTLPIFFLSIIMLMIFSGWLDWFPTSGMLSTMNTGAFEGAAWWKPYTTTDFLLHYTLPLIVITLRYSGLPALIMRTSVVEVMGQDFIYYHRITGLNKLSRIKHVAKHASLPVLTVYPVTMTRAVGGLVLLEVVFDWPGIGFTLVKAVLNRDFPTIQFVFFLVAAFVLIGNLVVDILYGVIDPRVSVDDSK